MNPETRLKIRKSLHKKIIDQMNDLKIDNSQKYYCDQMYLDNPEIIITDFGNYCPDEEEFNESFGTVYYQAPEIILKGDCTKKVDIWALGCTIFEFLVGKILFEPEFNYKQSESENHIELMINYCGNFNERFLKSCNRKNIYFDKSNGLIKRTNSHRGVIEDTLEKKMANIDNKTYWIQILSKMLRLTPRDRIIDL